MSAPARRTGDRLLVLVLGLLLVAAAVVLVLRTGYRDGPLEISAPTPQGALAVATVLRQDGTTVTARRTTAAAAEALRAGDTVLVTRPAVLSRRQLEELATARDEGTGHLVLLRPDFGSLAVLAPGVRPAGTIEPGQRLVADARCGPASLRARTIVPVPRSTDLQETTGTVYTAPGGAASCFREGDGAAVVVTDRVTVLGSDRMLTNDGVDAEDNPAIALNALAGPHLTWYVPSADDPLAQTAPGPFDLLPRWVGPIGAWTLLLIGLAVAVLAPRLGPVIVEPLPVTVRAQELTLGRARLLQRAQGREQAAAALRADAIDRAAGRLGITRHADAEAVLAGWAARGVPHDPVAAKRTLAGPAPRTDEELVRLASDLDSLTAPLPAAPHTPVSKETP
ncbi:DUF4350 domain-containing protein [Brachybacterium sp. EF45031]|uniref:DUF4350 domain-containing protein n=1 Tax=Brachybacterium sillae TaxID=2810536 RepID=UPI00217D6823|nr:DUF4350 domain-containing protein [Brachybacterium sillae]MCS6711015.1 DUF4350 domain-containing protein [Brachybacterium sillae]